ncbi:hypothetical protein P4B35_23505, partial [Pontiellaceae bacterium B12227]|nr:hypothetical protein [Pontiellaceae bacterium B12227]
MRKLLCIFCLGAAFESAFALTPNAAEELWAGYDARHDSLKVEVVREWDQGNGHYKLIRYSAGRLEGSNKSAEPMIAAYYGTPKNASKEHPVPALVQLHGGGQRAALHDYWVEMGYAVISINWGAKALEGPDTPNTDWDGLAAGFIGGRDQKHWNEITPGPNTLYREPHPMNSSWMLIATAARRALTFLEQQQEVDAEKIGVFGHSMGGRSTVLTVMDPRVKAACPSVGGSGFLYEDLWGVPGSARTMRENQEAYRKTVGCQAYWPMIKCPILFLGASNDFNSPTEWVVKGMNLLPETTDSRLALAPHLNHRFTPETYAARVLWFESKLKGNFEFPQTAK